MNSSQISGRGRPPQRRLLVALLPIAFVVALIGRIAVGQSASWSTFWTVAITVSATATISAVAFWVMLAPSRRRAVQLSSALPGALLISARGNEDLVLGLWRADTGVRESIPDVTSLGFYFTVAATSNGLEFWSGSEESLRRSALVAWKSVRSIETGSALTGGQSAPAVTLKLDGPDAEANVGFALSRSAASIFAADSTEVSGIVDSLRKLRLHSDS